jgi:hypothetical protein
VPILDIAFWGLAIRLSRNLRRVCERRGLCLFAGDQPEGPQMGHGHSAYGGFWQLMAPDGSPIPPSG